MSYAQLRFNSLGSIEWTSPRPVAQRGGAAKILAKTAKAVSHFERDLSPNSRKIFLNENSIYGRAEKDEGLITRPNSPTPTWASLRSLTDVAHEVLGGVIVGMT